MNLLIDNNDGLGQQDYTAYLDAAHLPQIARKLNAAATMTAGLASNSANYVVPACGGRVILQRGDGFLLFTGYLDIAPEMEYLGVAQATAWRYLLHAVDDSLLLDHNPLPPRTPFASRTTGDALKTLANDLLPGGLDESGVQEVSTVNEFTIVPQKTWTYHAQELSTSARAMYRVHDGTLIFQAAGQQSFTISDQDPSFAPTALTLSQPDMLRNDVTIIGALEPQVYVCDYFLGSGTTLDFYLSETPYCNTALTVFEEDYTAAQLEATIWSVTDPNQSVSLSGGQLVLDGGPATISYVEQVELGGGVMMQHGQFTFAAPSSGIVGGLYNGTVSLSDCLAGFNLTPSGSATSIQAIVNGRVTGSPLITTPGHLYALATRLFCIEGHRVHQTYVSSTHQPGNGRGGDSIPAALGVVLSVHDVDPNNPATLATPAAVLYDGVLASTPSFATYALISATSFFASVSYTRLEHTVEAEVRSMIPGGQFRTRLAGALADGGECYITSTGVLVFYAPYPPQENEQITVSYRSSARAMARVQDPNSIAQHAYGRDNGRRIYVRKLKLPVAPTSVDCENAASALLDDSVQPAWKGQYQIASDFLAVEDVVPGNAVSVSALSRNASFSAVVREVEVQVISLSSDRSQYKISFASDAAEPWALEFDNLTLTSPVTTIFNIDSPSSSLYINSLTSAQITNVIASEMSIDAGVAPPAAGGIEVRRSDGGWGPSSSDNLAGRFTTQTFTLPRISRVQGYYLRQYDGSTPAKYSRYSALLRVDYPL